MMLEEKFFIRKKMNRPKLLQYGFTKDQNGYRYTSAIMNGQLTLSVFISPEGQVSTKVIDAATNEEYVLYKVASAVGAYVGKVRAACEALLTDIAEKCFEPDVFHSEQTAAVIQYVREKYGDALEFLWEKSPDAAIWRRKDSRKWYGLITALSKQKLGLASSEMIEAMNLRLAPEEMTKTVDHKKYFPGWHMNKKSWYTVILDGSIETEELFFRIDNSFSLAKK